MKKDIEVKICGITNNEDALWATNLGADYIGLNFCSVSKRKVSIKKAYEIVQGLPSFIKTVGIFMNPSFEEISKTLKEVKLNVLQMHGEETLPFLEEVKSRVGLKVWKAVPLSVEEDLKKIEPFVGVADIILLDRPKENSNEILSSSLDWELAAKAKSFGVPLFLAGGLTLEDLSHAINTVQPKGVDVARGVEKEGHPGKKDVEKMRSFIQIAKGLV